MSNFEWSRSAAARAAAGKTRKISGALCRRAFLRLCVGLAVFGAVSADAQEASKPLRILTVGNSFASNALRFLPGFFQSAGQDFLIARANLGGCPMDRHVRIAELHDKDPKDPEGRPYKGGFIPSRPSKAEGYSLRELLVAEPWDFVTIQQVSGKSYKWSTYEPAAGVLIEYIRRYAPQARILIHETWAYREDSPYFGRENWAPSQDAMYDGLVEAYHKLREKYGFEILPSGYAIQRARLTPRWTFRYPDKNFDFANAAVPALPEQPGTLNIGWMWSRTPEGKRVLINDSIHLNTEGCYLVGAVWFEVLTGRSVLDNTFVPPGMSPEDAALLRKIAHEAVKTFAEHGRKTAAALRELSGNL